MTWGNLANRLLGITHAVLTGMMSGRAVILDVEFSSTYFPESGAPLTTVVVS